MRNVKISDYSGSGDYLFASNLQGTTFRLLDLELYEGEDLEHDVYGKWIRTETEEFEEGFLAAPGELIGELQRFGAEPGEEFVVEECKKSGPKQTDPYRVELQRVDPDQSRLGASD